jgi:hypothetical protein
MPREFEGLVSAEWIEPRKQNDKTSFALLFVEPYGVRVGALGHIGHPDRIISFATAV